MSEPTNLRRVRKQKLRAAKERAGAANRTREGQSKAERALRVKVDDDLARRLAGARLDKPDSR